MNVDLPFQTSPYAFLIIIAMSMIFSAIGMESSGEGSTSDQPFFRRAPFSFS